MKLVLAVTSPTAFLQVNQGLSIEMAIAALKSLDPSTLLTIAISQSQSESLQDFLRDRSLNVEVLICEPTDTRSFAEELESSCRDFDALIIHDASRPLTSRAQFAAVLAAFNDDTDAVRPAMEFTETLKILDSDSVIKKTLDRSTVNRISTPELIRISAIDFKGTDCGWFLPLKESARTLHIQGTPDGLRMNTVEDRNLLELSQD